ncbi:hypothetical protein ACFQJ7_00635 [Halovenus rubra]|uniref:Uncharacterized protein n=2 Tax=Halovenus rubra TaxID=869890 RepID=A0ACC7E1U4_9EURY|nr:hypothetical protein [Halovenus rubra]
MRVRSALFGTLGTLATGFGIGLLFVPDLLRGAGPIDASVSALSGTETTTIGLVAGLLVLVAFGLIARSRSATEGPTPSKSDSRFERAATAPPEDATVSDGELTAAGLDNDLKQAVESGGKQLRDVRSVLRETATSAYAERVDISEQQAAAVIDSGEWTDDKVAARFLGRESFPLWVRVRRWLTPTQERQRRIERTIAAIERVASR